MTKSRRTFLKVAGMGSVGLLACGDDDGTLDASTDAGMDVPGSDALGSDAPGSDASFEDAPLADAALEDTGPYVDNGLAPVLSNYRVAASEPSRVYFDSSKPITASTTEGFTVSGRMISGITINVGALSGHYVTVNEAFSFWDNNTIRYAGGSDVADPDERALYPFDLQYIQNEIPEPAADAQTLYVDGAVSSSGDGSSEGSAFRTLQEASDVASAGTTIFVKAVGGNGYEMGVRLDSGGSADAPVKVIGYKTTPGDLDGVMYYTYEGVDGDEGLVAAEMPLFRGPGGTTADKGVVITADFLVVRNLQATGFDNNFEMPSPGTDSVLIDGCVAHTSSRRTGTSGGNFRLNAGISARPDAADNQHYRVRVTRCIAVNAEIENYTLFGDHSMISDCGSYQDSNLAGGTDYLFHYRGSDSIYRNLVAHRDDNSSHNGHGYSAKSEYSRTEYNLTEDCTSHNVYFAIEARHANVRYNVFRNISCTRDDNLPTDTQHNAGVKFTSASYNICDNLYVKDGRFGIRFHGSTENDGVGTSAGHHNIIKNSVFVGCDWVLSESEDLGGMDRVAHDNQIIGCTLVDAQRVALLRTGGGANNKFVGCLFASIAGETVDGNEQSFAYEHCNFHDIGFAMPDGVDLLSVDPMFSPSPIPTNVALRAGVVTDVKYDRDGTERAEPPTIGAVEIP